MILNDMQIITVAELENVKKEMKFVREEIFQPFVGEVIKWYQEEIYHPVYKDEETKQNPPNLFNLFHYPNKSGEKVLNYLGEQSFLQQCSSSELERMMHDAACVLNGYHLFYYHEDDAFPQKDFFNPFVKEIW